MENTKRVTKAMKYEDVISLLTGETPANGLDVEAAVEFLRYELELLARKNSPSEKKPTAVQEANEGYKALILAYLSTQEDGKTCAEIQKSIPEFADFNNQKVAALLRALTLAEKVDKITVKGKSLFSIR